MRRERRLQRKRRWFRMRLEEGQRFQGESETRIMLYKVGGSCDLNPERKCSRRRRGLQRRRTMATTGVHGGSDLYRDRCRSFWSSDPENYESVVFPKKIYRGEANS